MQEGTNCRMLAAYMEWLIVFCFAFLPENGPGKGESSNSFISFVGQRRTDLGNQLKTKHLLLFISILSKNVKLLFVSERILVFLPRTFLALPSHFGWLVTGSPWHLPMRGCGEERGEILVPQGRKPGNFTFLFPMFPLCFLPWCKS